MRGMWDSLPCSLDIMTDDNCCRYDDDGGPLTREDRRSSSSLDLSRKYKLPADPWHLKIRWVSGSSSPLSYSEGATVH